MNTAISDTALPIVTRGDVEDLLYREAELLDRWELDEWLGLYTEDASYVVPTNDLPGGNPDHDMVLIDDDRSRMQARVNRLKSRMAHREYPHSRTSHQITNIRLGEWSGERLAVKAEFTVWRYRGERGGAYCGHYEYQMVIIDGALRIAAKRVELAMTTLRGVGDVAIVL
ncbi:aromatic-ring-hydroxylating dioxygenase subunit beta [Nocardia vaccinii]|uniref:aromatic-ring-hydroxylating dioxygenase subunit beta n=1 Tax=Nocardia vaccinii TaxID=1822 RepID=UPI00082BDB95|nr:aromatic-ring-hydroxylating dioxygenase subunit beta [Nocardia vaccinii]